MSVISQGIISRTVACETGRDKAIMLSLLAVASLLLAVLASYLCYLFIGPTSLGQGYNKYWLAFFFVCGFLASAFFVFRHGVAKHPENLFLAIVISVTCFYSLSFDVNQTSWDVDIHFLRVLEWSRMGAGGEISLAEEEMVYGSSTESHFMLDELNDFKDRLNGADNEGSDMSVTGQLSTIYNRIAALPGALVYSLCTLLSVPFTLKYVLSRLIYALIYSLVTYLGMKRLKSGKMLYAVIALLPTAVFLAANYSADYWINAFTLYAGATLVGELQTPDRPMSIKRSVLLLGSFFVAFGPKAIYFPLILLCLLIPKSKFRSSRASRLFRCATVLVSLLVAGSFLIPYFIISGPGVGDLRGGTGVNSVEQIKFILSEPFAYARILLGFLPSYLSPAGTRDFICFYAYLGYPSWYLWGIAAGLLVLTVVTDKGPEDAFVCTWKARIFALILLLGTVVLVATSIYVSYNEVRVETVLGCQPRYLIPFLFLVLVFMGSPKFAWPKGDKGKAMYNGGILGLMSFVLMVGIWQVYIGALY